MAQKRPTELQQSELDDLAAELTRRANAVLRAMAAPPPARKPRKKGARRAVATTTTEPQDPDLLEIPF
jgi:hypothetical protein